MNVALLISYQNLPPGRFGAWKKLTENHEKRHFPMCQISENWLIQTSNLFLFEKKEAPECVGTIRFYFQAMFVLVYTA